MVQEVLAAWRPISSPTLERGAFTINYSRMKLVHFSWVFRPWVVRLGEPRISSVWLEEKHHPSGWILLQRQRHTWTGCSGSEQGPVTCVAEPWLCLQRTFPLWLQCSHLSDESSGGCECQGPLACFWPHPHCLAPSNSSLCRLTGTLSLNQTGVCPELAPFLFSTKPSPLSSVQI